MDLIIVLNSTPNNSWAGRMSPLRPERQDLAKSELLVRKVETYLRVSSHGANKQGLFPARLVLCCV